MINLLNSTDSLRLSVLDENKCVAMAEELHEHFSGKNSFPIFWSLIDRDEKKLSEIFWFFCQMRYLLSTETAREVIKYLWERLMARYSPQTVEHPVAINGKVQYLAEAQFEAFKKLGQQNLIGPAFELFVAGSLNQRRKQFMTKQITDAKAKDEVSSYGLGQFEPDGAAFFLWAEFGILAAKLGFQSDFWIRVLPVLFRSEKIFALCWGKPELGYVPRKRKIGFYDPGDFAAIHPCVAKCVTAVSTSSIKDLESEATRCARFAFPGSFKSKASISERTRLD